MSRKTLFGLEALGLLDFGVINAAFQREVERVSLDCQDRPGDDHARTVQLKFLFAPRSDNPGKVDCDHIDVQCEITSAIPKRKTKVYSMNADRAGRLSFHPDLPDDPNGSTLYDEDGKHLDQSE